MKQVIRYLGALCLSSTALVGCADTDLGAESAPGVTTSALAASTATVKLRFVHGSPTSPALDIYIAASTTPTWTAVAFGTTTPFADVAPDGLQLVVRTAGAAATDAPLYTSDVVVAAAGDSVTSIAGGLLGSTAATAKFRIQAYTAAFASPERGDAVVRFVHDSHGVAAAGFDVDADGTIEAPGIAAFTASDAAGIAVERSPRGAQLAIVTGTAATKLTAFTLSPEVLAQRGGIFLVLVGLPSFVPHDTRGLALLAVGQRTTTLIRQNPTLYVLPAIPDSTGIDVFAFGNGLRGIPVAQNAGFGVLAPALQVAPSERGYGLIVTKAATGASFGWPLALESTGPLVAGERYLAVASGFADPSCTDFQCETGRSRVRLTVIPDGFDRTIAATGRMRGVAASPDAPAVDLGQFPPGTGTPFTGLAGLENLAYRTASDPAGASVTASPLNPGVRVTGSTDTLRFRFAPLSATDRVFGVIAGAFAPVTTDIQSRFIVVNAVASGRWTAQTLSPEL